MIKGADVDDIIRKLVLAHADGELMGIALVFVNNNMQTEIEMSFGAETAFAMNTGIDLLKDAVMDSIKGKGQIDPKERE